jgi:hypothetical protein
MRSPFAVLVLLLLSPLAHAQPELPTIGSLSERTMLVWGGGRTREEAEAILASYQERAVNWARVLELGPGFPRIIEGTEVPGLQPGSYVVALGVCDRKSGTEMAKVFKALEPLAASRWVMWEEGEPRACPSLVPGWSLGGSTRVWAAGGSLAAALFDSTEGEGTRRRRGWLLVLGVLGKEEATTTVVEPPEEGASSEAKRLKGGRNEVVLEEWLTDPTCEAGPRAELHTRTWHFSARKGALVTKQVKKPLRHEDCPREPGEEPGD